MSGNLVRQDIHVRGDLQNVDGQAENKIGGMWMVGIY